MLDDFSGLARQILKIFGLTHPIRIGVAFCFAVLFKIILKLVLAYFPDALWALVLDGTPVYAFWLVLAGLFMVPVAFGKGILTEEIKKQILTIENMIDAAGLKGQKRALVWHGLIAKYLDSVKGHQTSGNEIDIAGEAHSEIREIPRE